MSQVSELGEQPFYNVPAYRHRSYGAVHFTQTARRGVHVVTLRESMDLSFYANIKRAKRLRVVFHGAVNRERTHLPRFDRVSTSLASDDAYLAFSDPSLSISDTIELGWYLGNRSYDPAKAICAVIRRVARQVGAEEILFIGGSGGGHAALRIAIALADPRVGCFVFSPQTEVVKYHIRHVKAYADAAGYGSGDAGVESLRRTLGARQNLPALYGVAYPQHKVYYFQNTNDTFHVHHHFEPFRRAVGVATERGVMQPDQFESALIDSVDGHGPPTPEEFEEHLSEAISFFWA